MPVGRFADGAQGKSEIPENGLINLSTGEFEKEFKEFQDLQEEISLLVHGKNVLLEEDDWQDLLEKEEDEPKFVAVCKTPVIKEEDGKYKSVGMPENILILPRGTADDVALKKTMAHWRLSIPGKMFDFCANAVDEDRGD